VHPNALGMAGMGAVVRDALADDPVRAATE
jgi:hypothetical protein